MVYVVRAAHRTIVYRHTETLPPGWD